MRSFLIGFLRQPFVYGLVLLGVIFVILRFTAPTRPSIEFEPAAESAQPSAAETPVLADRQASDHRVSSHSLLYSVR